MKPDLPIVSRFFFPKDSAAARSARNLPGIAEAHATKTEGTHPHRGGGRENPVPSQGALWGRQRADRRGTGHGSGWAKVQVLKLERRGVICSARLTEIAMVPGRPGWWDVSVMDIGDSEEQSEWILLARVGPYIYFSCSWRQGVEPASSFVNRAILETYHQTVSPVFGRSIRGRRLPERPL